MKLPFTILTLLSILAASPAFAQTKLLTSSINTWFDNATGQPKIGDSSVITYTSNLQTERINIWSLDSGNYVLTHREIDYAFDANGNLLSYTIQEWDDVNGWANKQRFTYTYNGNNKALSWLTEVWDGVGWNVDLGIDYTYDANGNLSTEGGLLSGYLINYTYNAQNLLELKLEQTLTNGNWVNNARTLYTYLPNTKVETEIRYHWIGNAWEEFSRISYTYDMSGSLRQLLSEGWFNGIWSNLQRESRLYDVNQNLSTSLFQTWGFGVWENLFLQTFAYDSDSDMLATEGKFWVISEWVKWNLSRYHYNEFVDAQNPLLTEFQIFPNPASTSITLKSEGLLHVNIFEKQGRSVRSQNLNGQTDETIQLFNLPSGNYFLQVLDKDGRIGAKPLQIRH